MRKKETAAMQMQDENSELCRFKQGRSVVFALASLLLLLSSHGCISLSNRESATVRPPSMLSRPPLYTLHSYAYVQDLAFSPDGKILACGSSNDNNDVIEFWDTQTRKLRSKTKSVGRVYVGDIAFSPDGKLLAAGYGGYSFPINLLNVGTGKLLRTLNGHKGNVDFVAFSADGTRLTSVSAYEERMIRGWNVSDGKMVYERKLQGVGAKEEEYIRSTAFSPDGKILAGGVSRSLASSAQEVSELRLWNVRTGQLIHAFPEQPGGIFGLAFSPDGQTLVGASSDTTLKVWDVKKRKLNFTLRGHRSPVVSVAFSRNGKWLISGSGDPMNDAPGEVLVWDMPTRKLIKILSENDKPVYSVAFSPDGKIMASSHDDKVKIWGASSLTTRQR